MNPANISSAPRDRNDPARFRQSVADWQNIILQQRPPRRAVVRIAIWRGAKWGTYAALAVVGILMLMGEM